MVEKIFMWSVLLACGIPAALCLLCAAACIFAGRFAEGILVFWLGLFPTSCTTYVWMCKKQTEEWDKETNKKD